MSPEEGKTALSRRFARLASGALIAATVPLLLFAPGAGASVERAAAPPAGVTAQAAETAIVPDVRGQDVGTAIYVLQAAGFVVQIKFGGVDCGGTYVMRQSPNPGFTAPVGTTVTIFINRQPAPGQQCP